MYMHGGDNDVLQLGDQAVFAISQLPQFSRIHEKRVNSHIPRSSAIEVSCVYI